MDLKTAQRLGLERDMVPAVGKVFGLCNTPVKVCGYVETKINFGDGNPISERVQVLDSNQPTLLLGRRFMGQLGQVIFDWDNGRVKLGKRWGPAQTALSGASPLARAMVANQESKVGAMGDETKAPILSNELQTHDKKNIRILLAQFDHVFALNHKRPSRCKFP